MTPVEQQVFTECAHVELEISKFAHVEEFAWKKNVVEASRTTTGVARRGLSMVSLRDTLMIVYLATVYMTEWAHLFLPVSIHFNTTRADIYEALTLNIKTKATTESYMVSPLIQNKDTSNSLPSSLHPDRRSPQKADHIAQ